MFGFGLPELLIIFFIVLLLFGASKLPEVSRTLADSAKEFRDAFTGGKNDKSFADITKEVSDSARKIKSEIKHGVTEVQGSQPEPDNAENAQQSQQT